MHDHVYNGDALVIIMCAQSAYSQSILFQEKLFNFLITALSK